MGVLVVCLLALGPMVACASQATAPTMSGPRPSLTTLTASPMATATVVPAGYLAGDAHTHTWLSADGAHSEREVAAMAFSTFGLDWMASTDHGGRSIHTATGSTISPPTWMWRSLGTFGFAAVAEARAAHPEKLVLLGVEWHMATHDHAGVSIASSSAADIAEFEYRFDAADLSTGRPGWIKRNKTASDVVRAAEWLKAKHPTASYVIVNHPSRKLDISAADLRELNDAAPTVAFGFEGLLGRHKLPARGGYEFDFGSRTKYARPYGGADYMVAQVGGVWDSLLGEGRRFFAFADSDFHDPSTDFWPGEYEKTYTWVDDMSNQALIAGLRSGNSYSVTGGIIDRLAFTASCATATATMGQALRVSRGSDVTVTVVFRVPTTRTGPGVARVDHVDLIGGQVHTKAPKGSARYASKTNSTTKVIRRWSSGSWKGSGPSGTEFRVTYVIPTIAHSTYLRLRATNLGLGVAGQTDGAGNPLVDPKGTNTPQKAWADCWMYSNPVFIEVVR